MEQNTSKVYQETSAPVVTASGAGSALFVINLCASMAPIAVAGKTLPGLESYRLYQVARAEDGRTRHRLRLGFFVSEADAAQTLEKVRADYPTAFTACLGDEDKKFTRGFVTEAAPAPKPQMSVVIDNDSTRPLKALRLPTAPAVAAEPAPAPGITPVAPAVAKVEVPVAAKAVTAPPPAAKPVEKPVEKTARLEESAIVECDWVPAKAEPVAAKPAAVEIEMTWDPPAVPQKVAAPVVAPTVAAAAAPVPKAAPPAATKPAPVAATPAIKLPQAPPAKAAAAPPVIKKSEPTPTPVAKTTSLELDATGSHQRITATGQHRGMIAAPAPSASSINLVLAPETAKAPAPAASQPGAAAQPFHVGKGVELPTSSLTLDTGSRAPATAKASPPINPAAAPAIAAKKPEDPTAPFSQGDLDSTQTIRALTDAELNDEAQEKWFAIQLAVSEQPVNLDAMPHLDIFEAYRLYSIATAGSGKITHSLRIGFFREQVSAEAVSGYLKTFFPNPSIVRISVAEHARFKDAPEAAVAEPANDNNVVALSDARARKPPVIPTVTMAVEPRDTNATGSFKPNATGSFKPNATGSFKSGATGSFKTATSATGSFKPNATGSFKTAAGATGAHKALKTGAKGSARSTTAVNANRKASATGKHPALPKKRLSQELREEALEVELEESGVRQLPKSGSLLSRLVGKLSK